MEKIPSRWSPQIEEEIREFWKKNFIVEKWRLRNLGKDRYNFLEGPPYTSGTPHLGHTWNRALKDVVIRYYAKIGKDVWVQSGFDMHGLPIEEKVERKLGIKNKKEIEKIGVDKFIEECKSFAYGSMKKFMELYDKLAHWQDTDYPYMPITNDYIEKVWELIKKAHEKGLLYESEKPVWWCPRCQTSLAKHEIELGYIDTSRYKPAIDPSIYVKFRVMNPEKIGISKDLYLVIWTTTPWTLTYNLGVMVNPNIDYVVVETKKASVKNLDIDEENKKVLKEDIEINNEKEYWILAKDLVEKVMLKLNITDYKIVKEVKGRDLEGLEYEPPFYDELKDILVNIKNKYPNSFKVWLSEEYVTTEEGTGLVHAAPGCGPEDYEVGLKYNVKPFNTVNEEGYISELPMFSGWRAKFDDLKWIYLLRDKGILLYFEWYEHDYPICWRCGTRLIIRTTTQWFFNVQKIKDSIIKDLDDYVRYIPDFSKEAIKNNIRNAPDWVITRQRYWGIPLSIWKCKNNHTKIIGSIEELKREVGSNLKTVYIALKKSEYARKMLEIYFDKNKILEVEELPKDFDINNYDDKSVILVNKYSENLIDELSKKYNVIRSFGYKNYELLTVSNFDLHKPFVDAIKLKCDKCGEIMERVPDVLDVWIDSGSSTFATGVYPVDFILEGIDQLRGWFYSLAILGKIYFDKVPYRNVYVHGFTLDSKGLKMSKSLGNVIDPFYLIDKYGADATRLYLVSSVKAYEDVKIDPTEIKNKLSVLNMLWNSHKYLIEMSEYYKFNPRDYTLDKDKLRWEDIYMLTRLDLAKERISKYLSEYKIWLVGRELESLYNDISRFYIKVTRERLEKEYKIVLWIIYKSILDTINISSIVLPHISEKIFQNLKYFFGIDRESVILEDWPKVLYGTDESVIREKQLVDAIIELGLKFRDKKKINVRQPLRAVYVLVKTKESISKNSDIKDLIKRVLNVKDVKFVDNLEFEDYEENQLVKVYIDTTLDTELVEEGLYREIQRRLQNIRKTLGLKRIEHVKFYVSGDKDLINIIEKFKDRLEKTTGSSIFINDKPNSNYDYYSKISLKDSLLEVYVVKQL